MYFFPGDKPTVCFSNITLVAACAFDFIQCALAMFGVNHVLVKKKKTNYQSFGGLKIILMLWDLSTNFNDSGNLGTYLKTVNLLI